MTTRNTRGATWSNKLSHNTAVHFSLTSTEITVFDFAARNFTVLSIFQKKAPKISTKLQTGEVSDELGNILEATFSN